MPLAQIGGSNGSVPFGAVRGGTDVGGHPLYICSASYFAVQNVPFDNLVSAEMLVSRV
jgi:hypothetical protein